MTGQTILLVDDEPDVLEAMREILADAGYDVRVAEDGTKALAWLEVHHAAVVVTDFHMPGGLSGLELLQALKARNPDLVCVLMTGFATLDVTVQALKLGAYDFLAKPFHLSDLQRVLDRALDYATLLVQLRAYRETLETRLAGQMTQVRSSVDAFLGTAQRLLVAVGQPRLEDAMRPFLDVLERQIHPAGLIFLRPHGPRAWRTVARQGPLAWPPPSTWPTPAPGIRPWTWAGGYRAGLLVDVGSAGNLLGRCHIGLTEAEVMALDGGFLEGWMHLVEAALAARKRTR